MGSVDRGVLLRRSKAVLTGRQARDARKSLIGAIKLNANDPSRSFPESPGREESDGKKWGANRLNGGHC